MKKMMRVNFLAAILLFTSIATIAQPVHYYDSAVGKSCAALKTALKKIVTAGNNPQSYNALWNQYLLTDVKPRTVGTGSTNVIYDIYSAIPGGTDPYQFTPTVQRDSGTQGTAEGQRYNKEHSVPRSWFNVSTSVNGVATDYLFVIPTDKYVNGKRSNMPYCEVATASQTFMNGTKIGSSSVAGITGELNKVFEPIDSFKGDVARSFFYFITRYEDDMATWPANTTAAQAFGYNTFPSVTIPFLQMMLRWHHLDPVSTREKTRNNGAYTFQGNRNPYVDHPEYVDSVWNANCPGLAILPVDITYFTGKVNGDYLNLNWDVNTEINLSHYEVERSFNGVSYTTIATQLSRGLHSYSYNESTDNIKGKRAYYRIKKVDKDGKFSYSEVFTIHLALNPKITVYPNPAKDIVTIDCKNAKELIITDYVGRIMLQINNPTSHQTINCKQFTNGTYFVKLIVDEQPLITRFVIEK